MRSAELWGDAVRDDIDDLFEPPTKGCRDKLWTLAGVLAGVIFVTSVMYLAARATA